MFIKTASGDFLVDSNGAYIVVSYSTPAGPTQGEIRWVSRRGKPSVARTISKKPPKKYQPKWFGKRI